MDQVDRAWWRRDLVAEAEAAECDVKYEAAAGGVICSGSRVCATRCRSN